MFVMREHKVIKNICDRLWGGKHRLSAALVIVIVISGAKVVRASPVPANAQIECGMSHGLLSAQFGTKFDFRDKFSVVYNVLDRYNRRLFTEIVPITTVRPLLGMFVSPLNINHQMKLAVRVDCFASATLGNLSDARRCPYPTPVDNGVTIKLIEMEISKAHLYIRATATHTMLGGQIIGRFQHDKIVLISSHSQIIDSVVLNGLDPQPFSLETRLTSIGRQTFGLGAPKGGGTLLWMCIK